MFIILMLAWVFIGVVGIWAWNKTIKAYYKSLEFPPELLKQLELEEQPKDANSDKTSNS